MEISWFVNPTSFQKLKEGSDTFKRLSGHKDAGKRPRRVCYCDHQPEQSISQRQSSSSARRQSSSGRRRQSSLNDMPPPPPMPTQMARQRSSGRRQMPPPPPPPPMPTRMPDWRSSGRRQMPTAPVELADAIRHGAPLSRRPEYSVKPERDVKPSPALLQGGINGLRHVDLQARHSMFCNTNKECREDQLCIDNKCDAKTMANILRQKMESRRVVMEENDSEDDDGEW